MKKDLAREWKEVNVVLAPELSEAVSNRLFELGAQGVEEADGGIKVFFESREWEKVKPELDQFLVSLSTLFPKTAPATLSSKGLVNEDWAEAYKKFYQAKKLSNRFFLLPSWDETTEVPHGLHTIRLDPGQAFGTGLHPTTCLCLSLIEKAAESLQSLSEKKFLDVGTGTGILAIAAWKLGLRKITAIDNDPIAVEAADKNVKENQVGPFALGMEPIESLKPGYDLIVSNILLETHRELAATYRRLLRPSGQLILSGLLVPQQAELESLLSPLGFVLESSLYRQEWAAFSYSVRA